MKEEIRRIMKLVKDGKLSPDDAADLIEAFEDSEQSERVGGGDEEAGRAEARPRSDSRADAPFAGDESADGGSVGAAKMGAAKKAGGAKGSHAADEAEEEEEDGADGVEEEVTETTGTKTGRRDPFKSLVDSIEKIGKDVAGNIDWTDVANKVKVSVEKGTEAVRKAADDAKHGRGKFRFGIIFGSQESKTVELPLTVPEGKILRIEGEAGDVRITGGAESGHLTATATFRAHNEEEAKAKAEEYTPMIEESEGQVLLRHPDSSDCTVDLDVYVPDGVPVEVRLQSGDIRVIDTRSSCRVMGRSGDVVLKGLDGTVDVSLHSGDVRIEDTKSAVMSIETKSGDITMIDTQGVVNVRTSSGDVRVRRGSCFRRRAGRDGRASDGRDEHPHRLRRRKSDDPRRFRLPGDALDPARLGLLHFGDGRPQPGVADDHRQTRAGKRLDRRLSRQRRRAPRTRGQFELTLRLTPRQYGPALVAGLRHVRTDERPEQS